MGAAIQARFPGAEVEQIAGSGGDFIVSADDVELWHKRQMGDEFPDHSTILDQLQR